MGRSSLTLVRSTSQATMIRFKRFGRRRAPLIYLLNGTWWCAWCGTSGFLPARVTHAATCCQARPLHWGPPIILGVSHERRS
jgi:hypothetical protein